MNDIALKQIAQEKGYSNEFCIFLDMLEKNIQLVGLGKYCVEKAIDGGMEEYIIIKVALANIGRAFSEFIPGERSRDECTIDEWAKRGEKEFRKHCTDSGRFRYEDFKYNPPIDYKPNERFFG